ncbi:MAG: DUF3396 domain-containing protein [Polyangiaceae bacterium]|nr:DUF3396 domain-containing protein [Polyangiaceae bacterium]
MSNETSDLGNVLDGQMAVKDSRGRVALQVALTATFYFDAAYSRETREAIVSACEYYFRRWGEHLRWALHRDENRMEPFGAGEGSRPRTWLPAMGEDEEFELLYHGGEDPRSASTFLVRTLGKERRPYLKFGWLRVAFPLLCFADGSGSLPDVMLDLCRMTKPVSGYGGIGLVAAAERGIELEHQHIVYAWAQRLPGLEVDFPGSHSNWLPEGREGKRDGIKGGNWLTALSDRYVGELGGADRVEADLKALDERFLVHRYDGGVLIQAGPRPELGDAQRDAWPVLYVKLAKYLKPLRVTRHGAFQSEYRRPAFDRDERSLAWLRRFDDR